MLASLQTFVRRNSVYVATIIVGAFAGEKVRRREGLVTVAGRAGGGAGRLSALHSLAPVAAVLTIKHMPLLLPGAACAQRGRRIVGVQQQGGESCAPLRPCPSVLCGACPSLPAVS